MYLQKFWTFKFDLGRTGQQAPENWRFTKKIKIQNYVQKERILKLVTSTLIIFNWKMLKLMVPFKKAKLKVLAPPPPWNLWMSFRQSSWAHSKNLFYKKYNEKWNFREQCIFLVLADFVLTSFVWFKCLMDISLKEIGKWHFSGKFESQKSCQNKIREH